ncbi:ABC transporter ATP-binding protein [Streptomyces sp. URMC 123]|uniref:ABC transporter ATP-binding protein n=1 Tax=Streptomyces sp. URMC 123 TaxID=3423403 RepID=UPI003F1C20DA
MTTASTLRTRAGVLRQTMSLSWRADRRVSVVIGLLVAFQAVAVALNALTQQWLVDSAGMGTVSGVVAAAALGAFAYSTMAAGGRIQANLNDDLADRVDVLVHEEILTTVSGLRTVEHLERPEYLDRLAMLRRGTKALAGAGWGLAEAACAIVSLLLSVILLIRVHPALALLALCTVPPLWAGRREQRLVRAAAAQQIVHQRREENLHTLFVRPESGKEIRLAGAGPVLSAEAAASWDRATALIANAELKAAAWKLAGWLCFALGYTGALAMVAHLASRGEATVGDLMLVLTLGGRLRWQVGYVVSNAGRVAGASTITDHYVWLREYAARNADEPTAEPPVPLRSGITLKGVGFTYPGGDTPALRGVDLHLRAGSTVAFVGDNGAGKSTLVKLLTGMYAPTEGTVEIDGTPLADISAQAWRRHATGAFQDFVKLQLPVREAVGVGRLNGMEPASDVAEAIRRAGAHEFVERLPQGADTQLGPLYDGVDLSHGQWQRLALARGLIRDDAVLLVLDEPTAALDPQTEHDLYEQFTAESRGREGRVTILVSHRFSTVHMADHIVVLQEGRVVEHGSHDELMANRAVYAKLYGMQADGYAMATG